MNLKNLFQKAFVGGQWYVGYRKKGNEKYQVIDIAQDMWIADPMLFTTKDDAYLEIAKGVREIVQSME